MLPQEGFGMLACRSLCHSSWCFSASHFLMSSVTDLFETPITGSRPVGFRFDTSLASLSAVSFPLIPLCQGIQWTMTWLSSASLFNALWYSQTSVEVVTHSVLRVRIVRPSQSGFEELWSEVPKGSRGLCCCSSHKHQPPRPPCFWSRL